MNFRVFRNEDDLAEASADVVIRKAESSERLVVSLSGGSTPERLYTLLGQGQARDRLAGRNVVWVMGDERCVPPDHEQSNQRMVRRTLFRDGISPEHRFLPFRPELEDPDLIARQFEEDWRAVSLDRLDLALLGIGEDGHTASLFPGTDLLEATDRVAAAVWVEKLGMWRVTMTLPMFRAAAEKLVLAAGEEKRDIIRRINLGESFPIVLTGATGDEAWWMVDDAAYPEELRMGEGTQR
jgi:6-phosphogluconolactonase